MSLDSVNARLYGVTYAWGDVNPVYNQFGSIGHPGVDVGAVYQPIYAEFPGTVIACSYGSGYGNHVKIKDIDGDIWVFCHLSQFGVSVGQEVMRGEPIGTSGESGFVTGPHCHIECFPSWGGNPDYYGTVDPIAYLSEETRDIPEYGVTPVAPEPVIIPPVIAVENAPRPIEEAPAHPDVIMTPAPLPYPTNETIPTVELPPAVKPNYGEPVMEKVSLKEEFKKFLASLLSRKFITLVVTAAPLFASGKTVPAIVLVLGYFGVNVYESTNK